MLVLLSGLNNIERGPSSGNSVFISTLCNAKTTLQIQFRLLYFWACLEICYFRVSHTKAPTLKVQVGWQTNPATNNSKSIWHWLTGKSFEERGDMLLLALKAREVKKKKKQLRLTLATEKNIFFLVTHRVLENVTWIFIKLWGVFLITNKKSFRGASDLNIVRNQYGDILLNSGELKQTSLPRMSAFCMTSFQPQQGSHWHPESM